MGYTHKLLSVLLAEPCTVEYGLPKPTLKLKRTKILIKRYRQNYEELYEVFPQ